MSPIQQIVLSKGVSGYWKSYLQHSGTITFRIRNHHATGARVVIAVKFKGTLAHARLGKDLNRRHSSRRAHCSSSFC